MEAEQFRLHGRMEENHWWFTGRRNIVQRLVHQVLPPGLGHVVLDVGCGTGGNVVAFSDGYACFGWDPSPEAIHLAKERFPGVRFFGGSVRGAITALGRPPDMILLMDVLEHIQRDRAFFLEMVAALRPGGYLLITVPAGMELWSPHDVTLGHFRRYNRLQLEELWEAEPVVPLLVSHYNARLYPVVRCVRYWTQRSGRAAGEANTDLHQPLVPLNALLKRILSSEADVLIKQMGKRSVGFSRGCSLIALLQKETENSHGS